MIFFRYRSSKLGDLWTVSGILFLDCGLVRPKVIATRGESGMIYVNEDIKGTPSLGDFLKLLTETFLDHTFITSKKITADDEFIDGFIQRKPS